jgi:hypothetical protein
MLVNRDLQEVVKPIYGFYFTTYLGEEVILLHGEMAQFRPEIWRIKQVNQEEAPGTKKHG